MAEMRAMKELVADMAKKMYSDAYVKRYRPFMPLLTILQKPKDVQRFVILAKACFTCNTYEVLDKIKCPVFVLGGRQDKVVTGVASEEIAAKLGCKPVKNMIIRAVLDMNMPEPSPYSVPQNDDSDDSAFSDIDNDVFTWNDEDAVEIEVESSNLHIQWSKDYKRACKLYYKKDATGDEKKEAVELLHSEAEKGNVLAIHDLGKVYADDKEKSDAYYKQALDGFLELEPMSQELQPYLQYRM